MNLTSPTQVKAWCIEHGFSPSKSLGQNFLIDRNVLEAIVEAAGVRAGERVLEVGPGLGVLTQALLRRGAEVVAIEKDRRLARHLVEWVGTAEGLRVVTADALRVDWDDLFSAGFDRCVSNLPYSVGTRILMDMALHPRAPRVFTVLVQSEVAERFAAAHGTEARGQAGVWLQLDYTVQLARKVRAVCFWPRPEVESTVVRLEHHGNDLTEAERAWFFALTRHAFMQRRKQLYAVLRKTVQGQRLGEATLQAVLERAQIAPQERAEQISNEQWQALARACAANDRGVGA